MDMAGLDPSMMFMPNWERVMRAQAEEEAMPPQEDGEFSFFFFHCLVYSFVSFLFFLVITAPSFFLLFNAVAVLHSSVARGQPSSFACFPLSSLTCFPAKCKLVLRLLLKSTEIVCIVERVEAKATDPH